MNFLKDVSVASFAELRSLPFKKLRIIPFQPYPGALNMALDFYFASSFNTSDDPIIRFYGWQPWCLSLGFHQTTDHVDIGQIRSDGFEVVRRPTGGSAIFHSEELTYSIIAPLTGNTDHHALYQVFHLLLAQALNKMGFAVELHAVQESGNYLNQDAKNFACFNRPAFTEIKFAGKKIVGSAQKLFRNSVLQHGSVLIGDSQLRLVNFLKISHEKKSLYLKELIDKSTCIRQISGHDISELQMAEALINELSRDGNISIYYQYLTVKELKRAQEHVKQFDIE